DRRRQPAAGAADRRADRERRTPVIAVRLAVAAAITACGSIVGVVSAVSGSSRLTPEMGSGGRTVTDVQPAAAMASERYVGSAACRNCHAPIYNRWTRTRMANVVRDPKTHPDAIIPDLSKPDPLVTFKRDDIAFVYGSKWKQRYFTRVGDDYYPLGAQWDVTHKLWRRYFVADNTDWWVPHY